MTARTERLIIAFAAGLALLGIVFFAFSVFWHDDGRAGQTSSSSSSSALIKSDFELVDQTGSPIADEDFKGSWQLVFFGFTYCPDICPTTLDTVSAVMEALGSDADSVAPLFITVDPERDTPDVMADYVANFDSRIIGLTGSPEQIKAAAQAFRVYYNKAENTDAPDDYSMDHSAFLYLMGPNGEYVSHFSHNDDVEKIVAGIREKI
ncbi:MAG: SCO family protein [Alphaproteobacteria bacterium]